MSKNKYICVLQNCKYQKDMVKKGAENHISQ